MNELTFPEPGLPPPVLKRLLDNTVPVLSVGKRFVVSLLTCRNATRRLGYPPGLSQRGTVEVIRASRSGAESSVPT